MNWLSKFIANLNKTSEVDLSRRRVVKSIAGLAALAAVAPLTGELLSVKSVQVRFEELAKSGIITGQTFYLDRTLVLEGLDNIIISNCEFIALPNFEGNVLIEMRATSNVVIRDCWLDCRNIVDTAIRSTI